MDLGMGKPCTCMDSIHSRDCTVSSEFLLKTMLGVSLYRETIKTSGSKSPCVSFWAGDVQWIGMSTTATLPCVFLLRGVVALI